MTRRGAVADDSDIEVALAEQEEDGAVLEVDFDGEQNSAVVSDGKELREEKDFSIISSYFRFVASFKLLRKEDEVRLGKLVREQNDEDAKLELFHANLRFVITIAKRYFPVSVHMGFMDLIQEGNIGLWTAVKKFDERKGCKFSTHAGWWIRQAIARGRDDQERTIRLPAGVAVKANKAKNAFSHLSEKLGRQPDQHEIARTIKLSISETKNIFGCMFNRDISLEQPLSDGNDMMLSESIPDASHPGAMEIAIARQNLYRYSEEMRFLFSRLALFSRRERLVFRRRYGLTQKYPHTDPKTLQQVGDSMRPSITREGIRQLVKRVWIKLQKEGVRVEVMRSLLESDLEAIHCLEDIADEFADFKG